MRYLALALLLVAAPAAAAPLVIDFESVPVDTFVTTDFLALGVTFDAGHVSTQPTAHSGRNVLHHYQPEFHAVPIGMTFSVDETHVELWAGTMHSGASNATLKVFDGGGKLLAQDGPRAVTTGSVQTRFAVDATGIRRAELSVIADGQLVDVAMDDVSIDGAAPPPLTSAAPQVTITVPLDGEAIDGTKLEISARVVGDKLPAAGDVSVTAGELAGKPLHPVTARSVPLFSVGAVATGTIFLPVTPGPLTVTFSVQNNEGRRGSATVHVVNLPVSVRDAATAAFGRLLWAVGGNCTIGVYENGAIASGAGGPYRIQGGVFTEWLHWVDARYDSLVWSGRADAICPTGPERALAKGVAQNFRGGRIYSSSGGNHYVPAVFANAIDALGGEAASGYPIAEPLRLTPNKVWLFQRFGRLDQITDALPSTFELKGSPPVLWVERQGRDLAHLQGGLKKSTATVWESFPCSGNEGPCDLTPPRPKDVAPKPTCPLVTPNETPEWTAVISNDTISTVTGFISDSAQSGNDTIDGHDFHTFKNLDGTVNVNGGWSDWSYHITPFPRDANILGSNNNGRIEVEFEYPQAAHFFAIRSPWDDFQPAGANPNRPLNGDLAFVAGRWVYDCEHAPYATEIHPPFLSAHARTVLGPITADSPPTQRITSTEANIWINGWYTGAPIDVTIFPPPRTSPADALGLLKTPDADAAMDVDVSFKTDATASTPLVVHFSSRTLRSNPSSATYGSLDLPKSKRGYQAVWLLSWWQQFGYLPQQAGVNWWP